MALKNRFLFKVLIALFCSMTACAAVQPRDREFLADEMMYFDPDLQEVSWHQHFEEVLEGSRGGFSGSGGGCGCK